MNKVEIQGRSFSKVICGTNPFYGFSHFSEARNAAFLKKFTDDYIEKAITLCLSEGINTVESSANKRIWKIISELKVNHKIQFIGTTRVDETSALKSHQQKLQFLLEIKADVCVIHSQFVDRPSQKNQIKGLQQFVDRIHEQGLLAGISTHKVSTVELCEMNDYGIDLYLFPLNYLGYVYPGYEGKETVEERIQLIQQVPKPFVIMKSLAAGRIPPQEGLPFVLENSKAIDLISLGIGSAEEAKESIAIVETYLEKNV